MTAAQVLTVTANLEIDPWRDLSPDQLPLNATPGGTIATARVDRVGIMPAGTTEGRPTIMVLVQLPDGRHVLAETTWRLWAHATAAMSVAPVITPDRDLRG